MNVSTIDLRVLGAVSMFAGRDKSRHFLQGVCLEIEPRAVTYVATDGRRLVAYRREVSDEKSPDNRLTGRFIIPTEHCKPHKLDKDDDAAAKLFGDGRLTIAYNFCDLTFMPIDGIYPNWRRVIPRKKASGKLAQFDLELLAVFRKFSAALELGEPFIAHNGKEAPAPVWWPGRDHVLGVIMPCKAIDAIDTVPPEWVLRAGDDEQGDIEDFVMTSERGK